MDSISAALRQPKMLWAAKFWRTGMEVRDLINIISHSFDSIVHSLKGLSNPGLYILPMARRGWRWGWNLAGTLFYNLYNLPQGCTHTDFSYLAKSQIKPVSRPFPNMHSVSFLVSYFVGLKPGSSHRKTKKPLPPTPEEDQVYRGIGHCYSSNRKLQSPWKTLWSLRISLRLGAVNW